MIKAFGYLPVGRRCLSTLLLREIHRSYTHRSTPSCLNSLGKYCGSRCSDPMAIVRHTRRELSRKGNPFSTRAHTSGAISEEDARLKLFHLNDDIARHDYLYYVASNPEISDAEYDKLLRDAALLEETFPSLRGIVKKLDTVGAPPDSASFSLKTYAVPMLSLQNVYSSEELDGFLSRLQSKFSNDTRIEYIVEPKIDGVSLSLEYANGKLIRATTRGNGRIGEDVSEAAIAAIEGLPTELTVTPDSSFEIRGEVYMRSAMLEQLNSKRVAANLPRFSNPRNAASGMLRRKSGYEDVPTTSNNKTEVAESNGAPIKWLNFFAYSIIFLSEKATEINDIREKLLRQSDVLLQLRKLGFDVALIDENIGEAMVLKNASQVLSACFNMQAQRHEFPYETDGAVVKVNQMALQAQLGSTNKFPRWAVAFKFPADTAVARLLKIEVQVGRTGVLTPVAILSPVTIGGVTVSRATLHNEDRVNDLFSVFEKTRAMSPDEILAFSKDLESLKLDVVVCRSGDVIPKIISVYDDASRAVVPLLSTSDRVVSVYRLPSSCPCCGARTARELPGVAVRCTGNKFSCSAQRLESISHFCSRNAADIKGLGPEKLAALIEMGIVKNPFDLFTLGPPLESMLESKKAEKKASKKAKKSQNEINDSAYASDAFEKSVDSAHGWGPKSVANLISAIDKSRSMTSARFLYALGQQYVGLITAQAVVAHFGGFKAFWDFALRTRALATKNTREIPEAFSDSLLSIPRISSVAVESLWRLVNDDESRGVVNKLLTVVRFPESELGAAAPSSITSDKAVPTDHANTHMRANGTVPESSTRKAKTKTRRRSVKEELTNNITDVSSSVASVCSTGSAGPSSSTATRADNDDSLAAIIKGNTFVITGSITDRSLNPKVIARSDIERAIRSYGGRIGGSVTSKTLALICDVASTSAAPSRKYKDAQSRGIPVLDAATPWVQRLIDEVKANPIT